MSDLVQEEQSIQVSPTTISAPRAKVLCVTSYALSDDAASWRALNVAKALRDFGCAVTIHQYVRERPGTQPDVWHERFGEIPRKLVVSSRPSVFARHLRSVARENYDLVIGNNMNGALFSLLGRLKAPLVLDIHGDMVAELAMERPEERGTPWIRYKGRALLYRVTESLTRNLSDRISCVSRTMIRVLRNKGVQEGKLLYAPNCVDLKFFRPQTAEVERSLREQLGVGRDSLLFGYLGRLHRWQGVEVFLDAAREIDDPQCAFLVAGGDESKSDGRIHFLPEIPVDLMPEHYAACDVLVLPRLGHPATEVAAPTKFAEYAAMGKPILATDVGDAADLIRKFNCGTVVKANSSTELRSGIRQMMSFSPDERSRLGEAARRLAETEFDIAIIRDNLGHCIEELAGSHGLPGNSARR
jgi:glycosyltransferase involved in cell wall biosynthesis